MDDHQHFIGLSEAFHQLNQLCSMSEYDLDYKFAVSKVSDPSSV